MAGDGRSLTRRVFLGGLAAAPLAAGAVRRTAATERPRVAVIGAGAFGGWTAHHLLAMGAEVELIDSWGAGNPRSSSGGESRVIRAIYGPDRIYVEMVRRAFELWQELDAATAEPLYFETGSLWMHRGDDSYVESSLPILAELGFPVERPTVAEVAQRYPQIDFSGVRSVAIEPRSGVLSARAACRAVADRFAAAGGRLRPGRVLAGPMQGPPARLPLIDGSAVEADAFVFACGPWLGRLFPDVIGDRLLPTRQEVHYFGTPAGSTAYLPRNLPVWIDFAERIFYGLPDVHGRGFKIADDTRGEPFDPTAGERTPSTEAIARARRLLGERFPELAEAPVVEARVCQYENSPDGDLILDRHPRAANVWLVGGGSGHGFKLAPAVGERVAREILEGAAGEPRFALARLADLEGQGTQFDRREEP